MAKKSATTTAQPDPFAVYYYAVAYKKSVVRLGEQKPATPYIVSRVVLEALALEIFLKCVYRIRGQDIPQFHDLKKLFDGLSDTDREIASNKFDAIVFAEDQNKYQLTIDSVLDRCKHLFEAIRYGYEPLLTADQAAVVPLNLGLWSALDSVQSLILDAQPTFAARAEAVHLQ